MAGAGSDIEAMQMHLLRLRTKPIFYPSMTQTGRCFQIVLLRKLRNDQSFIASLSPTRFIFVGLKTLFLPLSLSLFRSHTKASRKPICEYLESKAI